MSDDLPIPPPNQPPDFNVETPMLKITKSEAICIVVSLVVGFLICLLVVKRPSTQTATVTISGSAVNESVVKQIESQNNSVIIIRSNATKKLSEYEKAKAALDSIPAVDLP